MTDFLRAELKEYLKEVVTDKDDETLDQMVEDILNRVRHAHDCGYLLVSLLH